MNVVAMCRMGHNEWKITFVDEILNLTSWLVFKMACLVHVFLLIIYLFICNIQFDEKKSALCSIWLRLNFDFNVVHALLSQQSIHGGRVDKALACNTRGDRFALHLWRYFRDLFLELIQSPARRDLKWSVWQCGRELSVTCSVSGDNL